ncbi:WhiB family transcriptional regulator [Neoactinobaculum massilliense]|uniref:WhiB family transcriptional regulator n=1 Tax=Neoactinobaculum massilliense TaxID=2364794 RepID=UPI000F5292F2|nr:WhiB family transcriptional regulator [Neoactinobaculum massilliense]
MLGIFDLGYPKAGEDGLAWQEYALCAQTDPDLFFPEKGGSTAPAAAICETCPVQQECLEYALSHDIRHGIWGGMSDNERRRVVKARRRGQGA